MWHSFNHIHKNNIYFDAQVWSLFIPIFERGKSKFSFEGGVLTHYGWCQFSSWGDGVGSVRCLWTAQQHGVLQVGVSLNVTHLEIHGVEQWTFQTGQASIKWGGSPLHHRWLKNTQPAPTLTQVSFCHLSSLSELPPSVGHFWPVV